MVPRDGTDSQPEALKLFDGIAPVKRYECKGDPEDSASWVGHDLASRHVIRGHSLQIDGDGNLDIFAAEMAKWTARGRMASGTW